MHNFESVSLDKAYRLFNLGATTLVSAAHEGQSDVMPAAWACPLDLSPCKATVVVDKSHYTRQLIEKSVFFALLLPGAGIVRETLALGSMSRNDVDDKLTRSGAEFSNIEGYPMPFVQGSVACAVFRVLSEPHNESAYDLFIGECVAAWADPRVFTNGHWHFESAPEALRTLHYVAGGTFYAIGEKIEVA